MNSDSNERKRNKRPGRGVKIAGSVLCILVGLVVLLTLVGYLLPSQVELVNTSSTLEVSSAELFPFFNSRAGQQRMWTEAWHRKGGSFKGMPPMEIADLGGPDAGAGTRLGFFPDGKRLGSVGGAIASIARGKGVIVESEPGRKVVYEIDFGIVVAERTIDFEALDENTTKVSWSETLKISNPLMRYLPLLVDSSINESFNDVLAALEEVAKADRSVGQ